MRSNRLSLVASLGALVALPALESAHDAPASRAAPDAPVVHRHPPRVVAPGTRPDRYDETRHATDSYNTTWTGYAVTGTEFTHVRGSWIVAAVDCAQSPSSDSSEWVGIDGWTSATGEQIGTDSDCNGSKASYYVWYEFYPQGTIVIHDVSIKAGDVFSAEVTFEGNNEYTVAITNETTGESFRKKETFTGSAAAAPKRDSAEWIEERDGSKLSDFGVDSFGKLYTGVTKGGDVATDSTTSGAIGNFGSVFASFSTKGGTKGGADSAVPSALGADGESFTVTWDLE